VTLVAEFGVKISQVVWRKLSKGETEDADRLLNTFGFELIVRGYYELAFRLLEFGSAIRGHSSGAMRNLSTAFGRFLDRNLCPHQLKERLLSNCLPLAYGRFPIKSKASHQIKSKADHRVQRPSIESGSAARQGNPAAKCAVWPEPGLVLARRTDGITEPPSCPKSRAAVKPDPTIGLASSLAYRHNSFTWRAQAVSTPIVQK
jgi:hypothetical protein